MTNFCKPQTFLLYYKEEPCRITANYQTNGVKRYQYTSLNHAKKGFRELKEKIEWKLRDEYDDCFEKRRLKELLIDWNAFTIEEFGHVKTHKIEEVMK